MAANYERLALRVPQQKGGCDAAAARRAPTVSLSSAAKSINSYEWVHAGDYFETQDYTSLMQVGGIFVWVSATADVAFTVRGGAPAMVCREEAAVAQAAEVTKESAPQRMPGPAGPEKWAMHPPNLTTGTAQVAAFS